jgi:hypothetical protein
MVDIVAISCIVAIVCVVGRLDIVGINLGWCHDLAVKGPEICYDGFLYELLTLCTASTVDQQCCKGTRPTASNARRKIRKPKAKTKLNLLQRIWGCLATNEHAAVIERSILLDAYGCSFTDADGFL